MTQQRRDNHSTEFGLWLRQQAEIDSKLGYVATNVDYIWRNYKTKKWMLIEEKRFMYEMSYSQSEMMKVLDDAAKSDKNYCGLHLLQFEKTNPEDGKIYIDHIQVTKEQLIEFLKFGDN